MLHVLHIANDYAGSKVYSRLVAALDACGLRQSVFTVARSASAVGRNRIEFQNQGSGIYYSNNFRWYHRLLFREKSRSNYASLRAHVDTRSVDYVHAHTLFSDGILALRLKKELGIPYIVTVRNTDINLYMRYMPHTWAVGRSVLREADRVVFISKAYMRRAPRWVVAPKEELARKAVNIPNGVDSYWLEHIKSSGHTKPTDSPWRLIYVGNFTPNKNVPRLMLAVLRLNKEGIAATLDIVGARGRDTSRIVRIAQAHPAIFNVHGEIRDKDRLRALFREMHIFALASLKETFGLVYVEALTQGLPILYSEGEGVDGFFDEHYGRSCNPRSKASITAALAQIIQAYSRLSIDGDYLSAQFDWRRIAETYLSLYSKRS